MNKEDIKQQINKLNKIYFPYENLMNSIYYIQSILLSLDKQQIIQINDMVVNINIKQKLNDLLYSQQYKLKLFKRNYDYELIKSKIDKLKDIYQEFIKLENNIDNVKNQLKIIKENSCTITINNYQINSLVDVNLIKNNVIKQLQSQLLDLQNNLEKLGENIELYGIKSIKRKNRNFKFVI